MDMDEFRRLSALPMWYQVVESVLTYQYPLPRVQQLGKRWRTFWKKAAENHIVDEERAPYTLIDGIPKNELYELDGFWCAKSPESHIGPFVNAIDFLIPDGTPVFAAQDGIIVEAVDQNTQWGDDETFRDDLNFMSIAHDIGTTPQGKAMVETTQYCHLEAGSIRVQGLRVGMRVNQGQQIANVGKSGWTDRDHLHFIVFETDFHSLNPFGFQSLVPRFRR